MPFDCVCKYNWLIFEYGIQYFNLILGTSQVGTLASLAFQLRCFFKYSQDVQNDRERSLKMHTKSEIKKLELEMVRKVIRRKRLILTVVIITVLLILGIFVAHVYSWHYYINKRGVCTYQKLYDSPLLMKLYDVYSIVRIIVSGLIDISIAVMTHITLSVLRMQIKENADNEFRREICQVRLIFWTFFVTYSLGFAYNSIMVLAPNLISTRTRFIDEILDIACFIGFDLIPIAVIMCAHFKSYSSINRIVRLALNQRKELNGFLDDQSTDGKDH